jgi:hypothetical protein
LEDHEIILIPISFTISSSLEIKIKPSLFKEKSFEGLKENIFQVPK